MDGEVHVVRQGDSILIPGDMLHRGSRTGGRNSGGHFHTDAEGFPVEKDDYSREQKG